MIGQSEKQQGASLSQVQFITLFFWQVHIFALPFTQPQQSVQKTIFAESNQRVLTFSSSNFNGQEEEGHILSTTRWGCS
jgi:hypothetical protein